MARQYYKDSTTGQMIPLGVKVEDTLPVGTIVEYNGQNIPEGWVDIGNGKIEKQYQVIPTNALLENGHSTSASNGYTCEYINKISDYSSTEQVIGRWIDGKPLYRKVFTGTCRSDANYIDLLTNVGIWFVEGGVIYETAEITRAYNYYFTQGQGNIDFDLVCGAGNLRFRARGAQIQGKNYMIIINYTKTTD